MAVVFSWRDLSPKRRSVQAAEVVRELYEGQPVPSRVVGEALGIAQITAHHRLARAQVDGLVRVVYPRGWIPSSSGEESV